MGIFHNISDVNRNTKEITAGLEGISGSESTQIAYTTNAQGSYSSTVKIDDTHNLFVWLDTTAQKIKTKIINIGTDVSYSSDYQVNDVDNITSLTNMKVVMLTSSKAFCLWQYNLSGYKMYAAIIDINVEAVTLTVNASASILTGMYNNIILNMVNSTSVVICFSDNSNSNYGSYIACTVSSGTITVGTKTVFSAVNTSYIMLAVVVNTNKLCIKYILQTGTTGSYLICGTLSGTTLTFGTAVRYNTLWDLDYTGLVLLANDSIMLKDAYSFTIATFSGTTITAGSNYKITNASMFQFSMLLYDTNKVLITYATNYFGIGTMAIISGTTITFTAKNVFVNSTASPILFKNNNKIYLQNNRTIRRVTVNSDNNLIYTNLYTSIGSPSEVYALTDDKFLVKYATAKKFNIITFGNATYYAGVKGQWENVNGTWRRAYADLRSVYADDMHFSSDWYYGNAQVCLGMDIIKYSNTKFFAAYTVYSSYDRNSIGWAVKIININADNTVTISDSQSIDFDYSSIKTGYPMPPASVGITIKQIKTNKYVMQCTEANKAVILTYDPNTDTISGGTLLDDASLFNQMYPINDTIGSTTDNLFTFNTTANTIAVSGSTPAYDISGTVSSITVNNFLKLSNNVILMVYTLNTVTPTQLYVSVLVYDNTNNKFNSSFKQQLTTTSYITTVSLLKNNKILISLNKSGITYYYVYGTLDMERNIVTFGPLTLTSQTFAGKMLDDNTIVNISSSNSSYFDLSNGNIYIRNTRSIPLNAYTWEITDDYKILIGSQGQIGLLY